MAAATKIPRSWCTNDLRVLEVEDHRFILNEICPGTRGGGSRWSSKRWNLLRGSASNWRAHVAGVTAHPDFAWVSQQGRNLAFGLQERGCSAKFLIHDRDSKYSGPFDEVFRTEGVRVIRTPLRAPRANAFAERWIRTVRTECLDWTLVRGPKTPRAAPSRLREPLQQGEASPRTRAPSARAC
jgi:hypothetical protein